MFLEGDTSRARRPVVRHGVLVEPLGRGLGMETCSSKSQIIETHELLKRS